MAILPKNMFSQGKLYKQLKTTKFCPINDISEKEVKNCRKREYKEFMEGLKNKTSFYVGTWTFLIL